MAKRKAATPSGGQQTGEPEPAMAAAIARYLDPEFYARVTGRGWISDLAGSDTMVRLMLVREGLPAQVVPALANALDLSRDEFTRRLGMPRATVERKLRRAEQLGQMDSERMLGVASLIALAERIVAESGDPDGFDAGRWTSDWLRTPSPALGGRLPIEFMDTADGRAVVSQLVLQMQSGTYA